MSVTDQAALEAAIRTYQDPYLSKDLFALGAVSSLNVDAQGKVSLALTMPYPCAGIQGAMVQLLSNALEDVDGVDSVDITVSVSVQAHQCPRDVPAVAGVKNIIAVASGKGGVGKSTTSINLALALAQEGARVGILDADIYGPSVGLMLGIPEGTRPKTEDDKFFIPIEKHGIQAMSMAFLVDEKTPMVWRGPMVSGAVQQLLMQTKWGDLDYLVVDMPPGTGDIQLTLSQRVPVTGSIIVTTPQDLALLDCKKGIEMFRKVEIPVLGVVENMSVHICSHCGHEDDLFGSGGGEKIAAEYQAELLAKMPLHRTIREQTDSGFPTVIAAPDSEIALRYRDVARKVSAIVADRISGQQTTFPEIVFS
ncbi:MAG: iron-sulfur cluster carrier protein ApbC [Hahellaceae bacterium]|nr:iron-sulfur cluster carrier protein ApbC [Hahellaceae bacterium]